MKGKKKILRGCLLLALCVLFLCGRTETAHADGAVARLTIWAHGTGIISNQGHTWLTIENISSGPLTFTDYQLDAGEIISVSIWPDTMSVGLGGVFINRELTISAFDSVACASLSVDITYAQLKKISSATPGESYYHDGQGDFIPDLRDDLWHNCTSYSTKMWNLVAPSDKRITCDIQTLGIDAPKWVKEEILTKSGASTKNFTRTQNTTKYDRYYLSQKNKLYAMAAETPVLSSTGKTDTTVSLSWTSASFRKSGDLDASGYVITYFKSSNMNKMKRLTVTGGHKTTATVTGLEPETQYVFNIYAYVDLDSTCSAERLTYETGRNISVTTKEEQVRVTVSPTKKTLYVGDTAKLTAKVTGTGKKVTWSSSNRSVATVSSSGKVTAKKNGKATITAKVNGVSAACKVTVKTAAWKSAYKKILTSGGTFQCKGYSRAMYPKGFALVTLSSGSTPVLVCADRTSCPHYVSGRSGHSHINVWAYKNGKAVYKGGYLTKGAYTYAVRRSGSKVYVKDWDGKWYGMTASGYTKTTLSGSYKTISMSTNNAYNRKRLLG